MSNILDSLPPRDPITSMKNAEEIEKLQKENQRLRMLLSILICSFEQTANQVKNVKDAL